MKAPDFSIEVFHKKINEGELKIFHRALEKFESEELYQKYNIDSSFFPENQSIKYSGNKYSFNPKYWKQFLPAFSNYVDSYVRSITKNERKLSSIKKIFSWINFFEQGDFFHMHTHDNNTTFSGVLFIKIPEKIDENNDQGQLYLKYGNFNPKNLEFNGIKKIVPVEGDLYIFPSWLAHGVLPHSYEDTRISMAFNIDVLIESNSLT